MTGSPSPCPLCLRKMYESLKFDPIRRYRALLEVEVGGVRVAGS